MISLKILRDIFIIAALVLLQGLVFDRMSFHQVATPYVYIIFILFYPVYRNRFVFLILCFLLGWGVDLMESTGGIHAFASLTLGYLVRPVTRILIGPGTYNADEFRFSEFNLWQWIIYPVIMIFIHHFILFFLESFSFSNFNGIILRTVYCCIFTLIFVYFYLILFRKRKER